MDQDEQLWKPENGYPPLCPPNSLKEELLRDENFILVDWEAEEAPSSLNESFDELVQYLTRSWDSKLHKLRAIFAWMGAQNIGCQPGAEISFVTDSPKYYLKEAYKDRIFIAKLFAKMCRLSRIPCILVKGKAKGASYTPGDEDIRVENTWSVVYVADSWRFVFPHWAFVKLSGHQLGNWMMVEDCGKPTRQRFIANDGVLTSDFDEFYFLTDPMEMNCICHPHDKDKQLLNKSWTQERFFTIPHFRSSYFSSKWQLTSPLECVINPEKGSCCIDFQSPGEKSKLNYKLFFYEDSSGKTFPQEFQTFQYVRRLEGDQRKSLMVRIPVTGRYKLEVNGVYQGQQCSLVEFRIVCDYVSVTRPFPSAPDTVFGFGDAAAEAGLSEPSYTGGLVLVKSGEDKVFDFRVKDGVDIFARLVHSTRTPEELRDNISVRREEDNATVTARLPANDPEPEYSLEIDTFKKTDWANKSKKEATNALNYLLTSDKALTAIINDKTKQKNLQVCKDVWNGLRKDDARELEKAACLLSISEVKYPILKEQIETKKQRYKQLRKNAIAAAKERNFDQLNRALGQCIVVNLQYRGDVEAAMDILMELCKEEVHKVLKEVKLQDLRECLNKMSKTCVGETLRKEVWFQNALQIQRDIEDFEDSKQKMQPGTDDDLANVYKPPDKVADIIVATFVLLGESKTELNTWRNVLAKLQKTNECQIFARMGDFDDSVLTQEQVDEAVKRLKKHDGSFSDNIIAKTLYEWCSDRIKFYRLREKLNRRT